MEGETGRGRHIGWMDRQTETDEQDGWMDSIKVYVCVCVHIRIVWAGGGGRERRMCG